MEPFTIRIIIVFVFRARIRGEERVLGCEEETSWWIGAPPPVHHRVLVSHSAALCELHWNVITASSTLLCCLSGVLQRFHGVICNLMASKWSSSRESPPPPRRLHPPLLLPLHPRLQLCMPNFYFTHFLSPAEPSLCLFSLHIPGL